MSLLPQYQILVIEDSSDDVEILQSKARKIKLLGHWAAFPKGEEATAYLEELLQSPARANEIPDLIFLDLKLPGENGFEILKKLKMHPTLQSIPVIVISASREMEDLVKTYKLGGTLFLGKPWNEETLLSVLGQLRIAGILKTK